jgi:hypothetical protein
VQGGFLPPTFLGDPLAISESLQHLSIQPRVVGPFVPRPLLNTCLCCDEPLLCLGGSCPLLPTSCRRDRSS